MAHTLRLAYNWLNPSGSILFDLVWSVQDRIKWIATNVAAAFLPVRIIKVSFIKADAPPAPPAIFNFEGRSIDISDNIGGRQMVAVAPGNIYKICWLT